MAPGAHGKLPRRPVFPKNIPAELALAEEEYLFQYSTPSSAASSSTS